MICSGVWIATVDEYSFPTQFSDPVFRFYRAGGGQGKRGEKKRKKKKKKKKKEERKKRIQKVNKALKDSYSY